MDYSLSYYSISGGNKPPGILLWRRWHSGIPGMKLNCLLWKIKAFPFPGAIYSTATGKGL
jgi:hypothetical protein